MRRGRTVLCPRTRPNGSTNNHGGRSRRRAISACPRWPMASSVASDNAHRHGKRPSPARHDRTCPRTEPRARAPLQARTRMPVALCPSRCRGSAPARLPRVLGGHRCVASALQCACLRRFRSRGRGVGGRVAGHVDLRRSSGQRLIGVRPDVPLRGRGPNKSARVNAVGGALRHPPDRHH